MDANLIPVLKGLLQIELPQNISFDEIKAQLADHINDLIRNDFQKLVGILYRIDVSESKLKQLLKENPDTDAGIIITDLIIERQLQKIKSRKEYKRDENISDDEKW